ncbi:flagellar hook assembly protein FlgD [Lysinibacillus sp. LZ02]|uniref:flagellar hook assembly protein FlgD n=1 Tax=Lysinibacillus sp. LZ02 TaxID=3420668 RepID=UPI003D36E35B
MSSGSTLSSNADVTKTTKGITNDYYLNTSKYKYTTESDNSTLGKDAFLHILIAQLQNQDPTNPMDDREFIAQMAQFSSLEQMQNMTKAMEALLMSQRETQLMSYTSFIGKEVKWHELSEEEEDEKGDPVVIEGTGVITEVKFKDGAPIFVLDSGKEISAGHISAILGEKEAGSSTGENPFAQASQLIGKTVQYNLNDESVQAVIEAITTKNGVIEYILNNGTRLTKEQFEVVSETENTETEQGEDVTDTPDSTEQTQE